MGVTLVPASAVLFAELLVDLSATFAYGFIARQLARDPRLVAGNRALRWLAAAVACWYAGCLIDEATTVLAPGQVTLGPSLDAVRGPPERARRHVCRC
jgi:hypothetical protein